MQYHFEVHDYPGSLGPSLSIGFDPENAVLSGAIMDVGGGEDLLKFINQVVSANEQKNEYWTNGYTVQAGEENGRKNIKIYFRLADGYEPCNIEPELFKKLLESWQREKEKFGQDPEAYKKELKWRGGKKETA